MDFNKVCKVIFVFEQSASLPFTIASPKRRMLLDPRIYLGLVEPVLLLQDLGALHGVFLSLEWELHEFVEAIDDEGRQAVHAEDSDE